MESSGLLYAVKYRALGAREPDADHVVSKWNLWSELMFNPNVATDFMMTIEDALKLKRPAMHLDSPRLAGLFVHRTVPAADFYIADGTRDVVSIDMYIRCLGECMSVMETVYGRGIRCRIVCSVQKGHAKEVVLACLVENTAATINILDSTRFADRVADGRDSSFVRALTAIIAYRPGRAKMTVNVGTLAPNDLSGTESSHPLVYSDVRNRRLVLPEYEPNPEGHIAVVPFQYQNDVYTFRFDTAAGSVALSTTGRFAEAEDLRTHLDSVIPFFGGMGWKNECSGVPWSFLRGSYVLGGDVDGWTKIEFSLSGVDATEHERELDLSVTEWFQMLWEKPRLRLDLMVCVVVYRPEQLGLVPRADSGPLRILIKDCYSSRRFARVGNFDAATPYEHLTRVGDMSRVTPDGFHAALFGETRHYGVAVTPGAMRDVNRLLTSL